MAFGAYPEISLAEARAAALQARSLVAKGIDPMEERKRKKDEEKQSSENTYLAIMEDWLARKTRYATAEYLFKVRRRQELYVLPFFKDRSIQTIKPVDILKVLRLQEAKTETANRLLREVNELFRHAVQTAKIEHNPCESLKGALKKHDGTHFKAALEGEPLSFILKAIDTYPGNIVVKSALQLAPIFFVRPGELTNARWEDIDLEEKEWRYYILKTDTHHIVPLCNQACVILANLHKHTGHQEWVFQSSRKNGRPISREGLSAGLKLLGIEDHQTHGWRATARTLLDETLGFDVSIIEHQLAHAVKDANGRAYNRTTKLLQRKVMMQKWADFLDGLRGNPKIIEVYQQRNELILAAA